MEENNCITDVCPKCGKIIHSRTKSQAEYNMSQHLESHKRKEKKGEEVSK